MIARPVGYAALAILLAAPVAAQTKSKAEGRSGPLGEMGSSKAPINIDSDKLDVFDKEGRAVFSGNVVAVQGDATMRCSSLNIFYEQAQKTGAAGAKPAAASAPAGGLGGIGGDNASIKKIDCAGPVTIVSKTQVATGDNAEFDRVANRVYLIGNAAISDGPNVTRGERVVYDLNSGVANVETRPGGRVKALFVPGSNKDGDKSKPGR